jgi:hypothetical protein
MVKMKEQYEKALKDVRAEQRELEIKRKKDMQDLAKLKEEELLKIRKEKKVLEQRAKNLQFSKSKSNNNTFGSDATTDATIMRKKLNEANEQVRDLDQRVNDL